MKKKLRVIIRADGNHQIGMGHVYRSMNLAYLLKKYGHKVIFLTSNKESQKILSRVSRSYVLPSNLKLKQKAIKEFGPDIIILDKLKEKTKELKLLGENGKVIAIDYIGNNKNSIDCSINMLYQRSGSTTKNSFSGFEYAILNRTFQKVKPIKIKKKIKSILVLQGGSDTRCFTPKIIDALNDLNEDFKITAILGPSFRCWRNLEESKISNKKPLKLLHNIKKMKDIMNKHDMAITAGGMTLLELCRLGIPSIVICGEKFENETATLLQRMGFCINMGYGSEVSKRKITKVTKRLLVDYNKRRKMNQVGKKIVDGKGTLRAIKIIERSVNRK